MTVVRLARAAAQKPIGSPWTGGHPVFSTSRISEWPKLGWTRLRRRGPSGSSTSTTVHASSSGSTTCAMVSRVRPVSSDPSNWFSRSLRNAIRSTLRSAASARSRCASAAIARRPERDAALLSRAGRVDVIDAAVDDGRRGGACPAPPPFAGRSRRSWVRLHARPAFVTSSKC